jgi:hypothetical protein
VSFSFSSQLSNILYSLVDAIELSGLVGFTAPFLTANLEITLNFIIPLFRFCVTLAV